MMRETPWEAGRFDAKGGPKKILFGRMYEDAAIEAAAFAPGGRVFCIASAGCMALALAPRHAVTAVDVNPVQLAYAERRAAGGPMQIGSAERIVGVGRRLMALFGWRRRTIASFLELEQPEEQMAFWNRHLNSAGFRVATDVLLSVAWLRSVYASPFLSILPPRFGQVMRTRLERCWKTHPNRTNPYARALLLGDLPATSSPPAKRTINFVCADAAAFLESCPSASFDGFTLSNILDGAPDSYRQRLLAAARHAAAPDAVVVLRSFAEPSHETATNVAIRDRSILWGVVEVRPARTL
jgi:S-adenosylmethionine:diacylglycerol 3-amino-3-carboxypropyl transferase